MNTKSAYAYKRCIYIDYSVSSQICFIKLIIKALYFITDLALDTVTYRSIDKLGSMLNFDFTLQLDQQMSLLGRYLFLKYIIDFMYWTRAVYIRGGVCLRSQGKISAYNVPKSVPSMRRAVKEVRRVNS